MYCWINTHEYPVFGFTWMENIWTVHVGMKAFCFMPRARRQRKEV